MISMTGYGKGVSASARLEITVEIKSVNNRYLDIGLKMPKTLFVFENKIREWIKSEVKRGKISVFIDLSENTVNPDGMLLNMEKITQKYKSLVNISTSLNLDEKAGLHHLVAFPEIFEMDYSTVSDDELMELLHTATKKAMAELNKMRQAEGAFLETDMTERVKLIEKLIEAAFAKGRLVVEKEFKRLKEQIISLIGEQKLDQDRLEQEIAIIADKVDITEECIRMRSHIKLFNETLSQDTDAGKRLNFILQEMLRETNTINSKTSDIATVHDVIKIKEEIEKLREQAQNIE